MALPSDWFVFIDRPVPEVAPTRRPLFARSELRHDRFGEWWFRCRKCKQDSLHHYYWTSALRDQEIHECAA